jgi:hypothetical protein
VLPITAQSVEPSVSMMARLPGPEKRLSRTTTSGKFRNKMACAPLTETVLCSKVIAVCPAGMPPPRRSSVVAIRAWTSTLVQRLSAMTTS